MDSKRFVTGSIVGGIVLFLVGYVIFNIILRSFYDANMGSATGVARDPPFLWAIALGCLANAALICYAMGARGRDRTSPEESGPARLSVYFSGSPPTSSVTEP